MRENRENIFCKRTLRSNSVIDHNDQGTRTGPTNCLAKRARATTSFTSFAGARTCHCNLLFVLDINSEIGARVRNSSVRLRLRFGRRSGSSFAIEFAQYICARICGVGQSDWKEKKRVRLALESIQTNLEPVSLGDCNAIGSFRSAVTVSRNSGRMTCAVSLGYYFSFSSLELRNALRQYLTFLVQSRGLTPLISLAEV